MAYQPWSVVFGETPSASKWNILGTNDAGFNDGTAIGTGAITTSQILDGTVTLADLNAANIQANQQAWQTMTPTGGSVTTTLGYFKDTVGVVHLRGQLNITGTGSFYTLPVGYRPEQYKEFITSSAGAVGVLSVDTAGVVVKIVGNNGNIDLDCVSFKSA